VGRVRDQEAWELGIERDQRRRAMLWRVLIGLGMVVVGVVLTPLVTVVAGVDQVGDMGKYWRDGPGEIVVRVENAREQTIWHEKGYQDGWRLRSSPSDVEPGLEVSVVGPDGQPVEVIASRGNSVSLGPIQRRTIAKFAAKEPGTYRVTLGKQAEGHRISVSNPVEPKASVLLIAVLASLVASVILVIAGVVLVIWALARGFIWKEKPAASP
jgi:hypothetical protein